MNLFNKTFTIKDSNDRIVLISEYKSVVYDHIKSKIEKSEAKLQNVTRSLITPSELMSSMSSTEDVRKDLIAGIVKLNNDLRSLKEVLDWLTFHSNCLDHGSKETGFNNYYENKGVQYKISITLNKTR